MILYQYFNLPTDLINVILSFLKLTDLPWAFERNFCHLDKWEFYLWKPKNVFREMIWYHRLHNNCFPGIQLYALHILKNEFHFKETARHTDISPTKTGILGEIFNEYFSLVGHGTCEVGMRKLIMDNWDILNRNDISFFDRDGHWFVKFLPNALHLMDSVKSSRQTWQTLGIGAVQSKVVVGIIGHPLFTPEIRMKTMQLLIDNKKLRDRLLVCYPIEAMKLLKFSQQCFELHGLGEELAKLILKMSRVPEKLTAYCQIENLRQLRGGAGST